MKDLPKLNLSCEEQVKKRCYTCTGCNNYETVLVHAASYQKEADVKETKLGIMWEHCIDCQEDETGADMCREHELLIIKSQAARDAVLNLAGMTKKDLEGM